MGRDIPAVLGRGYSAMTGSIHSSCVVVSSVNAPTYDYSLDFTDITLSSKTSITSDGTTRPEISRYWVASQFVRIQSMATRESKSSQTVNILMSVDKYYGSIDESSATLSADAQNLLSRGDIISFTQSCGPSYIRTIRRRSEVSVLLTSFAQDEFVGDLTDIKQSLTSTLGDQQKGESPTTKGLSKTRSNLEISIKAFGMGIGSEGLDVEDYGLVYTTGKDLSKIMEYAFQNMLNPSSGLVQSVEILPWSMNSEFQAAFSFPATILKQRCFDIKNIEISCDQIERVEETIIHAVSTQMKKINLVANSEHIVALDKKLRNEMLLIESLLRCLANLKEFNACKRNLYLISNTGRVRNLITGQSLMNAIEFDERGQYVYKNKIDTLNAFVGNYYGPCLSTLSEENTIFSDHWTILPACEDISCVMEGYMYDTDLEECVAFETDHVNNLVEEYCSLQITTPQALAPCKSELQVGDILYPGQFLCNESSNEVEAVAFGLSAIGQIGWFFKNDLSTPIRILEGQASDPDDIVLITTQEGLDNIPRSSDDLIGENDCRFLSSSSAPVRNSYNRETSTCITPDCNIRLDDDGSVVITDGTFVDYVLRLHNIRNGNNIYMYANENLNWEEHTRRAAGWGGHIVSIEDNDESAFLKNFLQNFGYPDVFIGYYMNSINPITWTWTVLKESGTNINRSCEDETSSLLRRATYMRSTDECHFATQQSRLMPAVYKKALNGLAYNVPQFRPMLDGNCLRQDGLHPSTSRVLLQSGNIQSNICLDLCSSPSTSDYTGCEIINDQEDAGCYAHTERVVGADGSSNSKCFIRSLGPELPGFCIKQNNRRPKLKTFLGGVSDYNYLKQKCIHECIRHEGYTGCEVVWNGREAGCYVHTEFVVQHKEKSNHFCWIR